ncbi:hypothetical protein P7D22_05620 [Lichenihabitans sp. Uapishka_5]|uniref:hypothetical protein n=1 Tax=Lichenihabitans sp. Uapishka_5 TaxID=3037302 RepID=UPI0029E820BD|nr:hypothetical protein [Lichenihabitans sp. Uapishka_5]MDX7950656.1 hypothetical protein [Lichenihabitans sp. Uapishka_5]
MTARQLVLAGVALLGMGSMVVADPLTCKTFKDRLGEALVDAADLGSEAPDFKDSRSTTEGGSHANWTTSALTGSLACGPGDRFQEFYVSLTVANRDRFADQLRRLVALDGAAVCSVAAGSAAACGDTGKLLVQDAMQQMGVGFKRRATNPSGTSDRLLWPDLKLEMTAAPTLITFSMAVPDGATLAEARRPLPALALPPANVAPTP